MNNMKSDGNENRKESDFRVRRRDKFSLELKFRHLLDPDRDYYPHRRSIRIRLAFFLPYSFNIRQETMEPENFYDDLKLYIRFNTPGISIEELLDPESGNSPLARIGRMLESPESISIAAVKYEAKLLGAVTKSLLRDAVNERVQGNGKVTQKKVDGFCRIIGDLHEGFSRYRWAIHHDSIPEEVRLHIRLIDEHLCLTLENYLVRMLAQKNVFRPGVDTSSLYSAILIQQRYRQKQNYPSVVFHNSGSAKREEYIYRYKMLKRYASSVLFFEIRHGNQARRIEHILYAVAAGIAMAIATAISFLGQIRFGTLSVTLFLVLVGAYMIKDRIKDAFRFTFQRTLGRLFYQKRTVFKDKSTHTAMGVVKERITYLRQNRLDKEVLRVRARGDFETAIMQTNPETVLEYTKLLHVYERRIHRTHRRIIGLADINVINLKNLLRHLARQRAEVPVISGNNIELERTRRIYHLNLLISADTGDGDIWHKVRLVVDAGGIRRVEQVGESDTSSLLLVNTENTE